MSYVSTFNALNTTNTTSGQKLVLSVIASFERNGKAWPSVATIAKRCSMGTRTVQRHIAALVSLGYLQRIYRQGKAAITRVFIGGTPAKLAPVTPAKLAPNESVIFESVNDSGTPPATPEPQHTTDTANAAIIVFTANEQPITPQALTKEIPDVFATDSMVTVSEVTGCHSQAGMPVEARTALQEPSQEVPATDTLADVPAQAVAALAEVPATQDQAIEADPLASVPAQLLADFGEVRRNKKKAAKVTRTEAKVLAQEAAKANWSVTDAILWCVLRGYSRFSADWVQHVPPQTAPAAPKVWQPEPHTPASPSTIAQMREKIAAMKARWNETPPPLPKGRG